MLPQQLAATVALCLLMAIGACSAQLEDDAPTVTGKANYAIVCSQVLRPGVDYRVGVALFQRSAGHGIQSVTARLKAASSPKPKGDGNSSSNSSEDAAAAIETIWQRKGDEVKTAVDLVLPVPVSSSSADPVASYQLEVTIGDTLGNRWVNSTQVIASYSPVTTLIQTDKAVYKPGQLVKFRIVNLDESLKPALTDMEVLIKDSHGNLVDKQAHNLSLLESWSDKAVMTSQFQLSDKPNEGDWTITAKSAKSTETKTFNVRQYVLPKFTVELKLPSFVHFNDSQFEVEANVLYTFDKAVEGTFNVTMGPYMSCTYCKKNYDQLETFLVDATASGKASFAFNLTNWRSSLLAREYQAEPSVYSVKVMVQFKEKFTGEQKRTEETFFIYRRRFELNLDTEQVPFFLPGFEVPLQVKLMQPNSQPYTGEATSNVTVSITYYQRGKRRVMEVFNQRLSASPIGTGASLLVKIPASADFHNVRVDARMKDNNGFDLHGTSIVNPFIGVTDDYVKVSLDNSREDIEMAMEKTAGIRFVYYSVLSRGQVRQWGKYSDSKLTLTKDVLSGYVPEVTLVAFGLAQNGEIVASVVKHEMSRLGGKVSIASNLTMDRGEPQQVAKIQVLAEPETFVFVTGIDASVNLLATGQDILQSSLAGRYKANVFGSRYWPRSQRLTTGKILQENGLVVMSDAFYYSEDDYAMYDGARSRSMVGASAESNEAPPPMASTSMRKSSDAGGSGGSGGGGNTQVRKFFPETMVWTAVRTDAEGAAQHTFSLPDTVTSWHLTAFGVAADKQIQTMDKAFKVTTFKNFFIRPVLPYSLVRGEKFLLKVLVFNYLDTPGRVTVTLNLTGVDVEAKVGPEQTVAAVVAAPADSAAVIADAAASAPGVASDAPKPPPQPPLLAVVVSLAPNSAGMALFEVTPRGLPSLNLTISGAYTGGDSSASSSYAATDVVIKSVIVVPEGKTVYRSRSVLLSPAAGGGAEPEETVPIDFPAEDAADLVPGSEVFSYSLIGDVMGPAMQNIGGLLRLPSGCGEQNMVNFAPAVFIWDYLSSTQQQNADAVKETAMRVMKVGLQRQLTYKRQDGSYSAFGERDQAGSAWLTAFVLSTYAKAAAFIAIEPEALTGKSVKFLLDRQADNGEFKEPPGARVLDRSLQGSSTKASHGMTAFTCLAMLDVDEAASANPTMRSTTWKDLDVKGSVTKCLWYVKSAFDSKADAFSSYDLALSAYLLRRAQASATYRQASLQRGLDAMLEALAAKAETAPNAGGKYWSTEDDAYWGGARTKTASVEATAWVLLGTSLAGDTAESLQILRWLSNRQNSLGGFQTSQATVVGVRALAAFAAQSGLTSGDAGVEVVIRGMTNAHTVRESRRLVLTQGPLLRGAKARVGDAVVRRAAGPGFALATLSWQYNLLDKRPLSADWKTAYGLGLRLGEAPAKPTPSGQFRLPVCARANSTEGMLILRVTNPSGFSASRLPEPSDVAGMKRVEAGPQEVVMYFDYLTIDGVCLNLWWTREVPVLELSPQLVTLQKYYSTEQIVSASYLAPELKAMTKCVACPECPGCKPKKAESWLAWLV